MAKKWHRLHSKWGTAHCEAHTQRPGKCGAWAHGQIQPDGASKGPMQAPRFPSSSLAEQQRVIGETGPCKPAPGLGTSSNGVGQGWRTEGRVGDARREANWRYEGCCTLRYTPGVCVSEAWCPQDHHPFSLTVMEITVGTSPGTRLVL